MKISDFHKIIQEVFVDFIALSTQNINQKGKYYVFESFSKLQNASLEAHYKLLIAFNSLNKDINAGLNEADECIEQIFNNAMPKQNVRIFFDGLKIGSIHEGLFVYEINITIKAII